MSGKKGMKHYCESIKDIIRKSYADGETVSSLSKKHKVSRYAIQSWCGLRPETILRQMAPLPKGRTKKIKTIEDYKKENQRLQMENELLRDFLHHAGRR